MPGPANIGLRGHRFLVKIENSSASQIHRVQEAGFDINSPEEVAYELGNINPTGSDKDPIEPSFQMTVNSHGLQLEKVTAGSSASVISLGDIIANAGNLTIRMLDANNGVVIPSAASHLYAEEVMTGAGVSRISYNFTIRGAVTEQWSFFGQDYYIETAPTGVWGPFDTTSPGLVKGRQALIRIGGNTTADTAYRLQSFTINVDFQSQMVGELGNRKIAGYNMGEPNVTVNFDVLESDASIQTLLTQGSGSKRIFDQVVRKDIYIMLYDPTATRPPFGSNETATPIKAWKLEGVSFPRMTNRRQVRGMATLNFSGQIAFASAAGTGGVKIFEGNPS